MNLAVICRVIDNYGDAGFSLRLSLELCRRGHTTTLLCDNPTVLNKLLPKKLSSGFKLGIIRVIDDVSLYLTHVDAVIECFGSSSCPNSPIQNNVIQETLGQVPWLVVDYLSAEPWVENFHGLKSINPVSGYESTYIYPGFSDKTGGVIHGDSVPLAQIERFHQRRTNKIFVFCYEHAPLSKLAASLLVNQTLYVSEKAPKHDTNIQPFCPLDEFDQMLLQYDWCFVRGEDSFVRAQLAGKPFVWQIYPTPDNAHQDKLKSFFDIYSESLDKTIRKALENLWWDWNQLTTLESLTETWRILDQHYAELSSHALTWAKKLRGKPDLVSEILRKATSGDCL